MNFARRAKFKQICLARRARIKKVKTQFLESLQEFKKKNKIADTAQHLVIDTILVNDVDSFCAAQVEMRFHSKYDFSEVQKEKC